ncbi:g5459 [Coccomyxa viridis]|uniref:G5459 protein n=1 Tax=Coccomyxa viridis TaxID=1274662 RepID=A0ABP1FSW1_9CHLO
MSVTSQEDLVDRINGPQQNDTLEAVTNELSFSCPICLEEHSLEDCYIASACGHRMCRDAARKVVLGAVRSCSFPVLCPICQAKSEPKCIPCSKRRAALAAAQKPASTQTLLHRISALFAWRRTGSKEAGRAKHDPKGPSAWCCTLDADVPLLLTAEEEKQYLKRSLKAAVNSCADLVQCPQPNCEGVAVAGRENESPALVCNACKHEWCGKCNIIWHNSKTCKEVQREAGEKKAEKDLEEYRKKHRIVNCPNCHHGTERISGCSHMTCCHCKTHFCWQCGQAVDYWSLSKRGLSSSQCCLRAVLHPPHQRLWPLRLLLLVQILAPMGVGVEVDVEVNVEAEAATRMVAAGGDRLCGRDHRLSRVMR